MDTNTEHVCERCGHNSTTKGNLLQHLNKTNECSATNSTRSRKEIIDELTGVNDPQKKYVCEFCQKKFSSVSTRSHHKKVCKRKPVLTPHEQEHKEMKQTILNMQKEILTLHGILRGMNKQIISQGSEITNLMQLLKNMKMKTMIKT